MTDILPKQMTDDQLALRRKGIGASEVGRIMEGNWLSLYEEKLGIKQPDDLSTVFAVQLGMQTEPFNIFWCQAMFPQYFSESDINLNNGPIDRVSLASYQHPNLSYSFLSATPDAWCTIDGEHGVMDCKHTNPNPWGKIKYDSAEDRVLDTYKWQMQTQMMCTETRVGMISPIYGNTFGPPIICYEDKALQEQILERVSEFWEHVQLKCEPVDMKAVKAPVLTTETLRILDEDDIADTNYSSEWHDNAKHWLDSIDAKKTNEKVTKQLKSLMPADARQATAYGIRIRRSKSNSLTISPQ